jgi:NTP pyrophosphatase (non-canonical NTP hydrolase)
MKKTCYNCLFNESDLSPCEECDDYFTQWKPNTGDLRVIQSLQLEWMNKNFPNSTDQDQLDKIYEEVGELARYYLRGKIYGHSYNKKAIQDAIGDIIISVAGFCNRSNLDATECTAIAWEEIKNRYTDNACCDLCKTWIGNKRYVFCPDCGFQLRNKSGELKNIFLSSPEK